MKEKKSYMVTARDSREKEIVRTTTVKSYGIRWAIEDASKEFSDTVPECFIEIIKIEKIA